MKEHYQSLIAGGIFAITPAVLLGNISGPVGAGFFYLFFILSAVFILRAFYFAIPVPFDPLERDKFLADHPEVIEMKKDQVLTIYHSWKQKKDEANNLRNKAPANAPH